MIEQGWQRKLASDLADAAFKEFKRVIVYGQPGEVVGDDDSACYAICTSAGNMLKAIDTAEGNPVRVEFFNPVGVEGFRYCGHVELILNRNWSSPFIRVPADCGLSIVHMLARLAQR